MWFTLAKTGITSEQLNSYCKQYIRTNDFFRKMFKAYGINIKDIWQLRFKIGKLKGRYAECQDNEIVIDSDLISKFPLKENMHFVAHEMVHWLTKKKEEKRYFSDPEEVGGFNWAIAHEIQRGQTWDQIETTFLPLIKIHFNNEYDAKAFLVSRFKSAKNLLMRKS